MSQGSSTQFSTSSTSSLHPVLQKALDSLDVELEEELIRYRRQRYRKSEQVGQNYRYGGSKRSTGGTATPELPDMAPSSGSSEYSLPQAIPQPTPHRLTPQPYSVSAYREMYQGLEGDTQEESIAPRPSLYSPQPPIGQTSSASLSALMAIDPHSPHSPESTPAADDLWHSNPPEAPDDYLESTEELLRSIAEEEPELRAEPEARLLDSLLTPLGIGSMLLLLFSSVMLGYVIMNPASLDFWSAREDGSGKAVTEDGTSPESFASPMIPDSPNLAAEEFVDLDINSLSTIPQNSGRSPIASPNPNASPNPSVAPAANLPQAPTVASVPESAPVSHLPTVPIDSEPPAAEYVPEPAPQEYSEPASEPPIASDPAPSAPSEVAVAPVASPPAGNYYYVVTDYTGDPSLEQAREAIPDAYVRNFPEGAEVQLGAMSNEARAEELLQELQAQGIPARIIQP
ncbi:MAG: hypothetical protein HC865_13910 [Cyanobacteria bacterium RU_5_0]|nr:hypothetical protein [Cyanobacteria bacterium RU_5_0]